MRVSYEMIPFAAYIGFFRLDAMRSSFKGLVEWFFTLSQRWTLARFFFFENRFSKLIGYRGCNDNSEQSFIAVSYLFAGNYKVQKHASNWIMLLYS